MWKMKSLSKIIIFKGIKTNKQAKNLLKIQLKIVNNGVWFINPSLKLS